MKKTCSKCKLKDGNKNYFAGYRELKELYGTTKKDVCNGCFYNDTCDKLDREDAEKEKLERKTQGGIK